MLKVLKMKRKNKDFVFIYFSDGVRSLKASLWAYAEDVNELPMWGNFSLYMRAYVCLSIF